MKMSDLMNEENFTKAPGIATRLGNVVTKGVNYLTKPQGLYKTEADRIAAQSAKDLAAAAERKAAGASDKLANAGSLEKQAKLQAAADKAAANATTAKQNLKTAPAPEFTQGQKVMRTGAGVVAPSLGVGAAIGNKMAGDNTEPTPQTEVEPKAEVQPQANVIPNFDDTEEKPAAEVKESIMDILKLAGQRNITERDNVAGIIKPAEIKTLTESAIAECGGMGMSTPTTASFSINATAGSGEEVAGMLMSIMQLAGVKPVTQSDMPVDHSAHMPMLKAIGIAGGDDVSQSHGDLDNDGDHDMDDHDMEKDTLGGMDTLNPGEHEGDIEVISVDSSDDEHKEKPIDEFANTPGEGSDVGTDVPVYDPEKMVFRPNTPGQGRRMDGTMPKGNPAMAAPVREDSDTTSDLFKAYEAFKNSN